MKTVAKVLIDTKATLEKYGWIQNSFGNPDTGMCIDGALMHVCSIVDSAVGRFRYNRAKDRLSSVTGQSIITWNDTPGRTKGAVFSLLDDAIAEELAAK